MEINTNQIIMHPGSGWKQLNGPVWEHESGVRIHWSGQLVRLSEKSRPLYIDYFESDLYRLLVRINGGNKKRGTMALALNIGVHKDELSS